MAGPESYFQSGVTCPQKFIKNVHADWNNNLQTTPVYALEPYSKQVKRCIEVALSCVDPDRHKRPSIGEIINVLNETETAIQVPGASMNHTGSTLNKGKGALEYVYRGQGSTSVEECRQTIVELEVRRELSMMVNLFGEVVDNYKLDKMERYMGKHKTREDRAREAWNLVDEHDKDNEASRYVKGLKSLYGNGQSTLCRVYNATGDTLYQV
ncbi:uncharacterized protein LOC125528538, partial [Triticum urartu]|uniref:uncharacterized protein LOC125528538 n=1 Tax=Triticum urartu TaxID=4572 RepID=UPI002043833C